MSKVKLDISMSLDGFVAGPDPTLEDPLGKGGEQLHEWIVRLASWREAHGRTGGERNAEDDLVREGREHGRRDHGQTHVQRWQRALGGRPEADGWWGDEPPFPAPVFVLTHHERETVPKEEANVVRVRHRRHRVGTRPGAGGGEKDVLIAGGADVAQQYLGAGLLDEISSTSRQCCSATASGCSMVSPPATRRSS